MARDEKNKLFDATYPGAATPLTQNRKAMPLVFKRDTGFDNTHTDETTHVKAQDDFGVEFDYLYVGEKHRARASGGVLVVEGYDGSAWNEAISVDPATNGDIDITAATGGQINLLSPTDFSEMPDVAGDPIVEEGSNSNGNSVVFSSGLQVCWGRNTFNTTIGNPFYGGYRSSGQAVAMPRAFISSDFSFAVSIGDVDAFGISGWSTGTASAVVVFTAIATDSAIDRVCQWIAIGEAG